MNVTRHSQGVSMVGYSRCVSVGGLCRGKKPVILGGDPSESISLSVEDLKTYIREVGHILLEGCPTGLHCNIKCILPCAVG